MELISYRLSYMYKKQFFNQLIVYVKGQFDTFLTIKKQRIGCKECNKLDVHTWGMIEA